MAGYNVVQSWELGYRYATVGGDEGKYRSDVNYGNGVRLLSSYLTINSRDGHGHWFDEIVLTTQGLGHHKILDAPEVMDAVFAFARGERVGNRIVASPNLPWGLA